MNILEKIYRQIIETFPQVPPENGGILGIRNGVVCMYQHDKSEQTSENAVYIPDVQWMNQCIEEWNENEVIFGGIVHSHMCGQGDLSSDDKEYINLIMNNMPDYIKFLYFPIVIPGKEMVCFRAQKRGNDIAIEREEINIES